MIKGEKKAERGCKQKCKGCNPLRPGQTDLACNPAPNERSRSHRQCHGGHVGSHASRAQMIGQCHLGRCIECRQTDHPCSSHDKARKDCDAIVNPCVTFSISKNEKPNSKNRHTCCDRLIQAKPAVQGMKDSCCDNGSHANTGDQQSITFGIPCQLLPCNQWQQ